LLLPDIQSPTPIEVTIERLLPGGVGLAHAEGRTLLVALAAPGDIVRVRLDQIRDKLAFASIVEIVTPSPVRVEPPCPYFGACGGCDFQQLSYAAQLDAKIEIIRDCLHRLARLEHLPEISITPSPRQWHYRVRANWQYDSRTNALGYFERGSRHVCDVAECAVLVPELQETLGALRRRMGHDELPAEVRDFRAIRGDDSLSLSPDPGSSATARQESEDGREISRSIHGETYRLNARSFFQANVDLLPQLIDAALNGVSGQSALDLYCGVGLFTIPLARRFAHVVGIEGDSHAARFARANLAHAGLTNADVAHADVGDWLKENMECRDLDFLLLDPPRAGAESRVIAGVLALKPKRICYVSCDPATLARDLKKLIGGGYTLDSIAAFDMFPQTHHVETLVHLSGPTL
jgi:tRNA/tmRNA/rRNA uracil-C5-methylase (TrmA/RlmC/RlmD family)